MYYARELLAEQRHAVGYTYNNDYNNVNDKGNDNDNTPKSSIIIPVLG